MGKINDIDITGLIKQKSGAPLGDAHELFSRAILMRLGLEVGKVDLSSSAYDIILKVMDGAGRKVFIRAQVKTVDQSLPLVGGVRAGIDRTYKSGVKGYKYSEKDTDLILGVDTQSLDIYVVPVGFIQNLGNSIGKGKLSGLKDNWDILLNWNQSYLTALKSKLGFP